jgi:hypothetical protein
MPINRAPFNALVDDDGSNSLGTPWNKAAIAGVILDPVDAALTQAWQTVPFSAANFSAAAPLVWTVGSAAVIRNRYTLSGKILFWSIYLSWFSGGNVLSGSAGPALYLTLPAGLSGQAQSVTIDFTAGIAGIPASAGLYGSPNNTRLELSKSVGGNFAVTDVPGMNFNIWIETT